LIRAEQHVKALDNVEYYWRCEGVECALRNCRHNEEHPDVYSDNRKEVEDDLVHQGFAQIQSSINDNEQELNK